MWYRLEGDGVGLPFMLVLIPLTLMPKIVLVPVPIPMPKLIASPLAPMPTTSVRVWGVGARRVEAERNNKSRSCGNCRSEVSGEGNRIDIAGVDSLMEFSGLETR